MHSTDHVIDTTSRSWADHVDMFDLAHHPLPDGPLLICPSGSGAVGDPGGTDRLTVGVDPIYTGGRRAALDGADRFETWVATQGSPPTPNDLRRRDQRTVGRAEFAASTQPLAAAALPHLPFRDRSFASALCSHLLFCYPQLGRDLHASALRELLRVAAEVRVYPTLPGVRGGGAEAAPDWYRDVLDDAGAHSTAPTRFFGHAHHVDYVTLLRR